MKRALILLSFLSFQLGAISVGEYFQQLPGHQPPIVNGMLDLSNKDIASLDGLDLLENPLTVTQLYLDNNQLTTLSAGIFDTLINLQALVLHNNQLTTLPAGIFDTLGNLQGLGLSNNQLTTLPAGIFDTLGNLQDIELDKNQFQETTQQFEEKYLSHLPNIIIYF